MPNSMQPGKWEVSAVRVIGLPDGWWQACIYWRGEQPPLLYGPICRTRQQALDYATAVVTWIRTPAAERGPLVWDGHRWVMLPAAVQLPVTDAGDM